MEGFIELLKKLLVAEFFYTKEEAEEQVKEHNQVVMQGIMGNNLRATAMALEMKREK